MEAGWKWDGMEVEVVVVALAFALRGRADVCYHREAVGQATI